MTDKKVLGLDRHKVIDQATGTAMVGHEWDGIEELDTPLPRWWLWTFYATIVFALGYVLLYPAIPMLHAASTGLLGWTSRGMLATEMAEEHDRHRALRAAIAATPIEALASNPGLQRAGFGGIQGGDQVGHPGAAAGHVVERQVGARRRAGHVASFARHVAHVAILAG